MKKPMIEVKTIPAMIDQVERQLDTEREEPEKTEKPKKKATKKSK